MTVQEFSLLELVLLGSKNSITLCSLVSWGSHLLIPLMNTHVPTQVHSVSTVQNQQVKGEGRSQKRKSTDRMRPDDTLQIREVRGLQRMTMHKAKSCDKLNTV